MGVKPTVQDSDDPGLGPDSVQGSPVNVPVPAQPNATVPGGGITAAGRSETVALHVTGTLSTNDGQLNPVLVPSCVDATPYVPELPTQ